MAHRVVVSTGALVVALDQLTKHLAGLFLIPGQTTPVLPQVLHLTLIVNPGIVFGLAPGVSRALIAASASAVAALAVFAAPKFFSRDLIGLIGAGLVAGGAVGNVVDRLRFGAVVDFIDFRFWPVFNVADVGIVCGAVMVGLCLFRKTPGENR